MPPPTVNGMNICFRDAPHHVEHDGPAFVAGTDVEEHQFIGPGLFVAPGNLDGIAGIAQIEKVDALDDPALIDVQARNDPFVEQRWLLAKLWDRYSACGTALLSRLRWTAHGEPSYMPCPAYGAPALNNLTVNTQ